MSAINLLWDISQESRISELEAQVKEQKEQIDMLCRWVEYLKSSIEAHGVLPIEAQGKTQIEAHRV